MTRASAVHNILNASDLAVSVTLLILSTAPELLLQEWFGRLVGFFCSQFCGPSLIFTYDFIYLVTADD